jgi:hypothetical protein
VARGGKGLWFKQVLQGGLEGGLVALNRQEVIAPLLKEDLLTSFHLGMQRVGYHQLAGQIQAAEHLPGRWDLVALGLGDDPTQILPLAVGRIDHFHAAMTHLLAIDNDQGVLNRAAQSLLPLQ